MVCPVTSPFLPLSSPSLLKGFSLPIQQKFPAQSTAQTLCELHTSNTARSRELWHMLTGWSSGLVDRKRLDEGPLLSTACCFVSALRDEQQPQPRQGPSVQPLNQAPCLFPVALTRQETAELMDRRGY